MLKTGAGFSAEKQHLVSLSDYLLSFSSMYDDSYQLKKQVVDYVLGICLSRSGGRITGIDPFSVFDECYYDKNVVIYNAGTFGQQLVNCFNEDIHCNVVKWIDDDFWEYLFGKLVKATQQEIDEALSVMKEYEKWFKNFGINNDYPSWILSNLERNNEDWNIRYMTNCCRIVYCPFCGEKLND